MIRGFESFKEWFKGYEDGYVIIGGAACDLIMSEEEMSFRATKDIDMVLIIEALTPEWNSINPPAELGEQQMQVAVNGVQKNYPRCIIGAGLANHSKDNGGISIL